MVLTLARAVEKYSSELEKKTASAASAAKATGLSADLGGFLVVTRSFYIANLTKSLVIIRILNLKI